MRQSQNKRTRGRSNNNSNNGRKGPNPLTRSFESNGPDVKIRGTAHHIAEKYLQLARDAQTSSDPVMAESYLQHAEHYFRLIAAAQAAQQSQMGFARSGVEETSTPEEDEEEFDVLPDRFASPSERVSAVVVAPVVQPTFEPSAHEPRSDFRAQDHRSGEGREPREPRGENRWHERNGGEGRSDFRNDYRARNDRGYGQRSNNERNEGRGGERSSTGDRERMPQERSFNERGFDERVSGRNPREGRRRDFRSDNLRSDSYRNEGELRETRGFEAAEPVQETRNQGDWTAPVSRRDFEKAPSLPAFITTPTRMPTEQAVTGVVANPPADVAVDAKPKRRRRTKAEIAADDARAAAAAAEAK